MILSLRNCINLYVVFNFLKSKLISYLQQVRLFTDLMPITLVITSIINFVTEIVCFI